MNSEVIEKLVHSWACIDGHINTSYDLLQWIKERGKTLQVDIKKIALKNNDFWFYDREEGVIRNKNRSFFMIKGLVVKKGSKIILEQPVILQEEIGYLGIICKEIDGVLNLLMQAKIEPGNVNRIQISPTIQATRSNFSQKHGGKQPPYLEYFINAFKYEIIVDQIQSEQSSRFFKKRNRNIIIKIQDDIELLPSHKWMTIGQIKQLMKIDNLVNMDTRTVLSCIPFCFANISIEQMKKIEELFKDKTFFKSIFIGSLTNQIPIVYQYINNYKMFDNQEISLVPLSELESWHIQNGEIICKREHAFKVVFCDITIEGREVKRWTQPLFEAVGMATFGMIMCVMQGIKMFLVRAVAENGCFDKIELGPSVQLEPNFQREQWDSVIDLFFKKLEKEQGIKYQVILSEEGGRFYHEQNYNIIINIDIHELPVLPQGYFWLDYKTLNQLVQINNCLNIQLRNLLSLLEV